MTLMAEKKVQYRIDVTPELAGKIDELLDERGFTRTEAMQRLLRWFESQPMSIQQMVLGQLPDDLVDDAVDAMIRHYGKNADAPPELTRDDDKMAENPTLRLRGAARPKGKR